MTAIRLLKWSIGSVLTLALLLIIPCGVAPAHAQSGTSAAGVITNPQGVDFATTTPSATLLARWQLNEGSGASAADASGNGNVLTLYSSPTWTSSSASLGVANPYALVFNGTSTQYAAATAGTIDLANKSFSVAFWAKRTAAAPRSTSSARGRARPRTR